MPLSLYIFNKPVISSKPNHSITTEPLIGSANCLSWSSSVQPWCKGQGVKGHLVKHDKDVDEKDKGEWEKIDAQLCSLLWRSIDAKLMQLFRPFQTCLLVWEKAHWLYTNDISRFYNVISQLTNCKKLD